MSLLGCSKRIRYPTLFIRPFSYPRMISARQYSTGLTNTTATLPLHSPSVSNLRLHTSNTGAAVDVSSIVYGPPHTPVIDEKGHCMRATQATPQPLSPAARTEVRLRMAECCSITSQDMMVCFLVYSGLEKTRPE